MWLMLKCQQLIPISVATRRHSPDSEILGCPLCSFTTSISVQAIPPRHPRSQDFEHGLFSRKPSG